MNCAICRKELFTENPKKFFCSSCYNQWKPEILAKAEWAVFLQNDEAKRRRQEKRDLGKLVYLGSDYDVSTDGRLIRIEFEIA